MEFEQEIEKIDHDHKRALQRIFVEKLLLGLVLAGAVGLGNYFLTSYESDLTSERYLLEERHKTLKPIRAKYDLATDIIYLTFLDTLPPNFDLVKQGAKLEEIHSSFITDVNSNSFIFERTFTRDLNGINFVIGYYKAYFAYIVHEDRSDAKLETMALIRFWEEVNYHFEEVTRSALRDAPGEKLAYSSDRFERLMAGHDNQDMLSEEKPTQFHILFSNWQAMAPHKYLK